MCAGLWGRVLAAARVQGTDALPARMRHQIGRDLIRSGESVFAIDTLNGRLRFLPTAMHHVMGSWRYDLHFAKPNGTTTRRNVARDGVLHLQWSTSPAHPWEGVSPLAAAPALAKLVALVESKMSEDLSTPTAHFLPTPLDGGATALDSLRSDIAGAKGSAILAQGTASGWEEGRTQSRHEPRLGIHATRSGDPGTVARSLCRHRGCRRDVLRHPAVPGRVRECRRDRIARGLQAVRHVVRAAGRGHDRGNRGGGAGH